jgi:hypothetical protein
MPTTLKDFKAKCDDAESKFKDILLGFVTSRVTNSLPLDLTDTCPQCKTGRLINKTLSKEAFKKPADRNCAPPVIATCDHCFFWIQQ